MSHTIKDNRYMEFCLGDETYAVPLLTVKEVIQKPEITSVPNMPPHFEGMMNLRGQILGVFNVRKRLAAKARSGHEARNEVVIVIEQLGVSVGMIVDAVTKVLHASPDSIQPAPLKKEDPARPYLQSVIKTDDKLVMMVDTVRLLDLDKYEMHKKVA